MTNPTKYGVLLVNLGTPTHATPKAVRRYLNEFLSDQRVVDLPAYLWQPLLKGIISPLRSRRSAKNYQKIWLPEGSPLRVYSENLSNGLAESLGNAYHVELAMSYGKPSITESLLKFRRSDVTDLIVLPLYPQYSSTTTASVFEKVTQSFRTCPHIPKFHFIRDYYQHPAYIAAVAESIEAHVNTHGKPQKLLFSFHGLPLRIANKGDPYPAQCHATANAIMSTLCWPKEDWQLSYQSRFGKAAWITPATLDTLTYLPSQGINDIAVLCPGFAVDCLETLEEINIVNRQAFIEAGGNQFHYIPALNAATSHIHALTKIIETQIKPIVS